MRRRKGQAGILGAVLIAFMIIASIATYMFLTNESSRYINTVNRAMDRKEAKISERLHVLGYPDQKLLEIENVGDRASHIVAFVLLNNQTGEMQFYRYDLTLNVMDNVNIAFNEMQSYPPYIAGVLTDLGNIFWDEVVTGGDGGNGGDNYLTSYAMADPSNVAIFTIGRYVYVVYRYIADWKVVKESWGRAAWAYSYPVWNYMIKVYTIVNGSLKYLGGLSKPYSKDNLNLIQSTGEHVILGDFILSGNLTTTGFLVQGQYNVKKYIDIGRSVYRLAYSLVYSVDIGSKTIYWWLYAYLIDENGNVIDYKNYASGSETFTLINTNAYARVVYNDFFVNTVDTNKIHVAYAVYLYSGYYLRVVYGTAALGVSQTGISVLYNKSFGSNAIRAVYAHNGKVFMLSNPYQNSPRVVDAIHIYNEGTGQLINITFPERIKTITISDDGKYIYAIPPGGNLVYIYDVQTGNLVNTKNIPLLSLIHTSHVYNTINTIYFYSNTMPSTPPYIIGSAYYLGILYTGYEDRTNLVFLDGVGAVAVTGIREVTVFDYTLNPLKVITLPSIIQSITFVQDDAGNWYLVAILYRQNGLQLFTQKIYI